MTAGQIPEICPVFYYVPDKAQALSEVFAKSQITAFLEAMPDKAESERLIVSRGRAQPSRVRAFAKQLARNGDALVKRARAPGLSDKLGYRHI